MNTLRDQIFELFADVGYITFDRLNEIDRRRLCAAYVRGDPSILDDLLVSIRRERIAEQIARLIEHSSRAEAMQNCDVYDLAAELWDGLFPDDDLASLVQSEMDRCWKTFEREVPAMARVQAD